MKVSKWAHIGRTVMSFSEVKADHGKQLLAPKAAFHERNWFPKRTFAPAGP